MNVEAFIPPSGSFGFVQGSAKDLDAIQDTLDCWSQQLAPDGKACKVWWRDTPNAMRVLAGALLAIDSNNTPSQHAGFVEELAGWLEQAGLLRGYQCQAVVAALAAPAWRSIVQAPAGSGKTHMAAGLVAVGAQLGICRWAYVVQNIGLARQTQSKFEMVIPEMMRVLGECDWRVACGSYGTIGDAVDDAQGLIVDEVHLVAAPTRAAAVAKAGTAEFRCGLSATPLLRQDPGNALVIGLLGPVRFSLDPETVIASGNLAQGHFHTVRI